MIVNVYERITKNLAYELYEFLIVQEYVIVVDKENVFFAELNNSDHIINHFIFNRITKYIFVDEDEGIIDASYFNSVDRERNYTEIDRMFLYYFLKDLIFKLTSILNSSIFKKELNELFVNKTFNVDNTKKYETIKKQVEKNNKKILKKYLQNIKNSI